MIFSGKGRIHLDGQKNLTDKVKPMVIKDFEFVYIPLLNMNSTSFEVLVEPGDSVKVGQMIAYRSDHFYVPLFSSISGTVESIDKMMSTNLVYAQHIKIKNDFKYERDNNGLNLDVNSVSKEEIIEAIKNSGAVGCGGSGFPTYIKYNPSCAFDTLLINGVECEPFITINYHMLKEKTDMLITGIKFMLKASGASKAMIAIKKGKEELKGIILKSIENIDNITLVEVPDVYPMGWERTLVKEVFNKTFDKIPGEVGIIVNNPATAISIGEALTIGQDYLIGLTISGAGIKNPSNVYVPIGTKISEVIEKIGGYNDDVSATNTKLIVGGPMMGKPIVDDNVGLNSYNNSVSVVYDEALEELPCLRCSRCVEYCPSGLQPVAIKDAEIAQNVDMLKKLRADLCVSCGLCSYICPSRIQVTDYTTKGKTRALSTK